MFIDLHRWWWYFLYNGTAGSKYLEYNPGSELNIFPWTKNNENWIGWSSWTDKSRTKESNKSWTKGIKQQNKRATIKIIYNNWQTSIMHNINKSRVSLLSRSKCDRPALYRVKNILVITELIIATLFDRVLTVRHHMLPRAFVLTQLSHSQKPFMYHRWLTYNTPIQITNLVP